MANILTITVWDSEDLVNLGAYGAEAVVRVQTSDASDGVFADVSGAGSTPTVAVVSGTRTYKAYDPDGASSSWYRLRYENADATRTSDWSDPFEANT